MRPILALATVFAASLALTSAAAGHGDHPVPPVGVGTPSVTANAGGPGATWEFVASIPTGNPHTDIDYFTRQGETYAAVGTLAIGPNAGGQTIIRLTQNGEVSLLSPQVVSAAPTASCVTNPSAALSLQHDIEVTPKGGAILNAPNPFSVARDAQLLIDATDAGGRCHDQGTLGLTGNPRGGLEIIDITDVSMPHEIGLTVHIGEAHTVNVDPKRPHIAYAVTSDSVSVARNADGSFRRVNQNLNLDGFEVVDLSSCMNFPVGTTLAQKRAACRPRVYRYQYPRPDVAVGNTVQSAIYGCHELEVYADDMLTCGGGNAAVVFDMKGAFDDRGTPGDFSDDRPRGTPLPCRVRPSSSAPPYSTGAIVTDCHIGEGNVNLGIPGWQAIGAPSLEGVRYVGSVHHMGGGPGSGPYVSTEDVSFDHELERSGSGRLLLATDERGGGVLPPGASCSPVADIPEGNGGLHAYRIDRLDTALPPKPVLADGTTYDPNGEAYDPYARTPDGKKAVFRAQIRTQAQANLCTSHVFHQIPGQNRIFMAWYSQGTRVVDFVENGDGSVVFSEAGWFIPAQANEWVSAVFKIRQNADGTYTYWGATGDFNVGTAGRNAVDVYKVTLPAPPRPLGQAPERGDRANGGGWLATSAGGKLNFGFSADQIGDAIQGELQLNDKGAAAKIHVERWTSIGPVGDDCGTVEEGQDALELRGTGRFNGVSRSSFRVCIEDGGEGKGAVDRFHLECTAGCTYGTEPRGADEVLDGGNVQVVRRSEPLTGDSTPTTLVLDPVLASTSVLGHAQTLSVRVFDGDGEPLPGATVVLTRTAAGGSQTLTALSGATGVAAFLASGVAGTEFIASAGGVQSNAVELTP